jgi:hypothetical protein
MFPDWAILDPAQLGASVLAVLVAASMCGLLVFRHARSRAGPYRVICACAMVAMASWFRFGALHVLHVDAADPAPGEAPRKVERHRLFQFHEFFHYYLGAKYFGELGYFGLYDCAALGDEEIAAEEDGRPRVRGSVRDLSDVLAVKTHAAAVSDCRHGPRSRFSPARWSAFKSDLRELRRLVADERWSEVVTDKGFNPSPSFVLLASAVANVVPIRAGGAPTYLLVTSLDLLLLVACFAALRSSFGATAAVLAAVYFGATLLASFGWLGGAVLRFTWVAAVVLALAAMRRGRWAVAGALMGWAVWDRVFPIGFAAGALVPVAVRSLRSARHRRMMARFGMGLGATTVVLVLASAVVFGASEWRVFFARMLQDRGVHNVLHVGLEKILAYRDWVPRQDFRGPEGFPRFRDWNLRVTATLDHMRPVAIPLQLTVLTGALGASMRRRPVEGALLCGVVLMFVVAAPASYYFVILALVPALLFRAAATAPNEARRWREYLVLTAFNAFWTCTLLSSRLSPDDIVYDLYICVAFAAFLVIWIAAWLPWPGPRPTPG